jgi:hypothetical protein
MMQGMEEMPFIGLSPNLTDRQLSGPDWHMHRWTYVRKHANGADYDWAYDHTHPGGQSGHEHPADWPNIVAEPGDAGVAYFATLRNP